MDPVDTFFQRVGAKLRSIPGVGDAPGGVDASVEALFRRLSPLVLAGWDSEEGRASRAAKATIATQIAAVRQAGLAPALADELEQAIEAREQALILDAWATVSRVLAKIASGGSMPVEEV